MRVLALLLLCAFCNAKLILVSLDGFRHDYIEMAKKAGKRVEAFEEIAAAGFRAEVQNIFITITFPTHLAMATGRYVENHGLFDNDFYDPIFNETFSYKSAKNQMEDKWNNYNNNEPIWLTNQRHGNRSCVFNWPGSNQAYKGKYPFATNGLYTEAPTFEYRVDRMMDWITQDDFSFCAFYFNEPDSTGHRFGPNSTEVLEKVQLVNDGIAYMLKKIKEHPKLKDNVDLIVTADHGMTYTPDTQLIKLYEHIPRNRYVGNVSPPIVGMWPVEGETVDSLYDALIKANLQHITVYKKHELPEMYHYAKSYRMPEIFIIADPGWMIKANADDFTKSFPYGMHGYNNSFHEMHPFMVAAGPGIKKMDGIQTFQQIDLYPFVCGLMRLQRPNSHDGSIDRALKFMANEPSKEFLETFKLYATGIRTDF
ncbi:unnamed protein product [Dibothriocephalus latus]|uniref:Extracellular Endonuclease subunit A domain-containing protein n=1 Tax=Dibothriocephalus latus TaxID=60516 RepID=A0A3P7L4N7_DIBLA|nr:unnamed protein product [Dibothriocephalus latus]